jgi:uncharacterized ferritin-like protein (DUF455 family)
MSAMDAPEEGTIERWAWDLVLSEDLEAKLSPPRAPSELEDGAPPRRIARPGRPKELVSATQRVKTPRPGALRAPRRRAQLLHTFLHHELQAAELLCWAILAFPETPRSFRRGLLGIVKDELAHMRLYRDHLDHLGFAVGSFPINDWFWSRVPVAPTPAHFVATLGMGLEGGNLDHAERFAAQLREAGDEAAARVQERVAKEEVPHVAFAIHWFERFTASRSFEDWRKHLPRPLSPMMMRGDPLNVARRREAGFDHAFLEELSKWSSGSPGS